MEKQVHKIYGENQHRVSRIFFWSPRILSILYILFLSIFSLDVIEPGVSLSKILLGLFIHNIPSLLLLLILMISWKYEIVGGIAFILTGIVILALNLVPYSKDWYWSLLVVLPALLTGALFLYNWYQKHLK